MSEYLRDENKRWKNEKELIPVLKRTQEFLLEEELMICPRCDQSVRLEQTAGHICIFCYQKMK